MKYYYCMFSYGNSNWGNWKECSFADYIEYGKSKHHKTMVVEQ